MFTLYPNKLFNKKNAQEIILDRYAIQGAYLNIEKFCNMLNFNDKPFSTPNMIMKNLIRCLTKDDKLFNQIDFDTIYDTSAITKIIETKFKRSSYIEANKTSLSKFVSHIDNLASVEGLTAHAMSAKIRFLKRN